jgi:hypothetical protein
LSRAATNQIKRTKKRTRKSIQEVNGLNGRAKGRQKRRQNHAQRFIKGVVGHCTDFFVAKKQRKEGVAPITDGLFFKSGKAGLCLVVLAGDGKNVEEKQERNDVGNFVGFVVDCREKFGEKFLEWIGVGGSVGLKGSDKGGSDIGNEE